MDTSKTADWLKHKVARLRPDPKTAQPRSLSQRLDATLRRYGEGLAPRALRQALERLTAIVDPHLSEVEAGRRAGEVVHWYAGLAPEERRDVWLLMSERFAPDVKNLQAAREHYETAAERGLSGEAEVQLRRAMATPRTRLLQRFAVAEAGLRFLVDLRAQLLPELRADARLAALDAELEQLFSTWFDVAFLELRRISWDSPASLIEKLIEYEAVHDIRSWADVKNRLDSDRRCYGFFHPRMPGEPLIFVEVALLDHLGEAIAPLLDEAAAPVDLRRASTAIFYSISNTQAGLRGVSFGDSLIKRVVQALNEEFPWLRTYATLSPMPGFRAWFGKHAGELIDALDVKERAELEKALAPEPVDASTVLRALETQMPSLDAKSPLRRLLMRGAARYLSHARARELPADPVARFHLGNGARVERINWAGDLSAKGLRQSYGLMVNYLYDLKRLDKHRAQLAQGRVPASKEVGSLAKS